MTEFKKVKIIASSGFTNNKIDLYIKKTDPLKILTAECLSLKPGLPW